MTALALTSTYRLQLHRGFPLDAARAIVPYLKRLGISHLYLSPVTTAQPGSVHGYDVIDYTTINPELGGRPAFDALAEAVHVHGLGLILDIVPNHMASAVPQNAWWTGVLAGGFDSPHAQTFDIDWAAARTRLGGKILLPILGSSYADALARGELRLAANPENGHFEIAYFDRRLPLAPGTAPGDSGAETRAAILHAHSTAAPDGAERLHALLERQHYRLAYWKLARDELNWRRFFEISDLVGVRVEREDVFEASHRLVFELYGLGLIDGLRIDHIDGLADPPGYCARLRRRLTEIEASRPGSGMTTKPYVVVEKILATAETLDSNWAVCGTTGYDFMNLVLGVLVDTAAEELLTQIWNKASGEEKGFDVVETDARRQILDENLHSELVRSVNAFAPLAAALLATRDISRAAIERACRALLIAFRVYRTYVYGRQGGGTAQPALIAALDRAYSTLDRADHDALELLGRWLTGIFDDSVTEDDAREATARFEQLAAPLAAKSVEDTAFYRYGRLLALNEVGGNPLHFGLELPAFHAAMKSRAGTWPATLNATATHDHKRGEDLRARLAVLGEVAPWWDGIRRDWHERAVTHRTNVAEAQAPDGADEYMLFQMLVGSWPLEADPEDPATRRVFIERMIIWQEKALREAKRQSSWLAHSAHYEAACRQFLERLEHARANQMSLVDVAQAARHIDVAGAMNALTQTFLRMTAPGVPDLYQGCERWDFSLVDPDNRRAVDYDVRSTAQDEAIRWDELLASWRDGRVKQAMISRVLEARHRYRDAFLSRDYEPLTFSGANAGSLIGFSRTANATPVICLATRLAHRFIEDVPRVDPAHWSGAEFRVERSGPTRWLDCISGARIDVSDGALGIQRILTQLPVALLVPVG